MGQRNHTSESLLRGASLVDWISQRSVRESLYCDGNTTGTRIQHNCGSHAAVTTKPFSLFAIIDKVPGPDSVYRGLASLNSGTSSYVPYSLDWGFTNNGNLHVTIFGASTAAPDARNLTVTNFRSLFANQSGVLHFVRPSSGVGLLYWNGALLPAVESTTGTPPTNWQDSITVGFVNFGCYGGSFQLPFLGRLLNYGMVIGALSAAEIQDHALTGRLPAWCELGTGSMVNKVVDGDFATDPTAVASPNAWTLDAGWTWNGATFACDVSTSSAAFIRTQSSAAASVWMRQGRKYRARVTISNYSAGTFYFADGAAAQLVSTNGQTNSFTANGTYEIEFVITGGDTRLMFGGAAVSKIATVDDIQLFELGPVFKPVIQPIPVVADNGASRLAGSITGVGIIPNTDRRSWTIQASTNTNGNQQILGQSVFSDFAKNVIDDWWINNGGTSKTVSLGNASAGTQYQNGGTFAAGRVKATLATQAPATNNLWVNSNGTDILQHTITGHLVD